MIITEAIRAKLLLHLPDDYMKQCVAATGYSKSMVSKVMHEGQDNDEIAEWLFTTAKSEKERKEKLHKYLLKITEQL